MKKKRPPQSHTIGSGPIEAGYSETLRAMPYDTPPNEAPIDTLYAFLSIDKHGRHGVVASILPGLGSLPLVTSKRRVAEQMKPIAKEITRETGVRIGMFVFKRDADALWTAEP